MVFAKSMTKSYFQAYLRRYVGNYPYSKNRNDAIRAAWNYFFAFNKPISEEAKDWFENNIGKVI